MAQHTVKKVLIIDDEIDICYLLSSILKEKNFRPLFACSLEEAKDLLKTEAPELVFLDNHLPDGRGVEFIMEIKALHPDSKVVMITAYDTFMDREQAKSKGSDLFISKPFTRQVIKQTIERLDV